MQKGIFLQDYNTKSGTVNNAIITLGDIDDSGKGRKFVSRFIQPGLVKIEGHGIVLLKKETLDRSLSTIVGAPVIIQHQDVTNENADDLRCGVISTAQYNEMDGWYYVEGIIWDEKAQELILKGWSVSCSYDFLAFNDEGGVENNIEYDKEFTELNFTHLAIVDNPRYERANIVFNCKVNNEDDKNGKWVTVKGNHIFIPDGKTLDEVIKEKGWGNKENKQSESKDKQPQKITKQMDIERIIDEHYEDDMITKEYADQLSKILGTKIAEEDIYKAMEKNAYSSESGDYDISKMAKDIVKVAKEKKKKEKEYEEWHKEQQKESLLEYDLKSMLKDITKDADYRYDKERKTLEVRYLGKWEGDDGSGDYDWQHPTTETVEKVKEIKEKFKKRFGYELSSDWGEKNWYYFKIKETKKNKTNNSKEQDMAIIEELKKLIFKVENNKENETMVENEKVDKRKLIDEVAGIMKSAGCDDEDIRTAIGKMEKIGYDDSEASADNKKVKNEADEEDKKVDNEEDKKEEDKKVDNEDDKEEDKVDNESDEDKEKAEDLKEDEKKDVENKCKNSVGNAKGEEFFDKINKIYNSAKKIEEPSVEYESKQARLEAGKEYFG